MSLNSRRSPWMVWRLMPKCVKSPLIWSPSTCLAPRHKEWMVNKAVHWDGLWMNHDEPVHPVQRHAKSATGWGGCFFSGWIAFTLLQYNFGEQCPWYPMRIVHPLQGLFLLLDIDEQGAIWIHSRCHLRIPHGCHFCKCHSTTTNARLHRRGRVYCRLLQDSWPSEGQEIDGKSPPSAAELMSAMAGFFFEAIDLTTLMCQVRNENDCECLILCLFGGYMVINAAPGLVWSTPSYGWTGSKAAYGAPRARSVGCGAHLFVSCHESRHRSCPPQECLSSAGFATPVSAYAGEATTHAACSVLYSNDTCCASACYSNRLSSTWQVQSCVYGCHGITWCCLQSSGVLALVWAWLLSQRMPLRRGSMLLPPLMMPTQRVTA